MRPDLADLKSRALTGNYRRHGNLNEADCVIAFAFGFRREGEAIYPGLSNEDLAQFIIQHCPKLPLFLQFEVADALHREVPGSFRIEKHRQAGQYLDTREVAAQAWEMIKAHSWVTALIVAHPYHMPRADAVCLRLGIHTVAPDGLQEVRFDPHSDQPWTRDPEAWKVNEQQALDGYRDQGWI